MLYSRIAFLSGSLKWSLESNFLAQVVLPVSAVVMKLLGGEPGAYSVDAAPPPHCTALVP